MGKQELLKQTLWAIGVASRTFNSVLSADMRMRVEGQMQPMIAKWTIINAKWEGVPIYCAQIKKICYKIIIKENKKYVFHRMIGSGMPLHVLHVPEWAASCERWSGAGQIWIDWNWKLYIRINWNL